jgi:hypothetical protein
VEPVYEEPVPQQVPPGSEEQPPVEPPAVAEETPVPAYEPPVADEASQEQVPVATGAPAAVEAQAAPADVSDDGGGAAGKPVAEAVPEAQAPSPATDGFREARGAPGPGVDERGGEAPVTSGTEARVSPPVSVLPAPILVGFTQGEERPATDLKEGLRGEAEGRQEEAGRAERPVHHAPSASPAEPGSAGSSTGGSGEPGPIGSSLSSGSGGGSGAVAPLLLCALALLPVFGPRRRFLAVIEDLLKPGSVPSAFPERPG